jgi:hypothetical protein
VTSQLFPSGCFGSKEFVQFRSADVGISQVASIVGLSDLFFVIVGALSAAAQTSCCEGQNCPNCALLTEVLIMER